MRKSSATTRNYRPGLSTHAVALSTFRDQMADYARAERLRELRDAIHLSREKVAGEIGVTTKTLYAWENGGSIRWENAKKLGAFYGVDPEGLVSREIIDGEHPQHGDDHAEPGLAARLDAIEQGQQQILSTQQNLAVLLDAISVQVAAIHERSEPKREGSRPAPGQRRRRAA